MHSRILTRPAGPSCAAIALLVALPLHAGTELSNEDRIRESRERADYGQAANVARDLLTERRAEPDAAAWQIGDAERLLRTLESVAALPEQAREKLAEADRLEAEHRAAAVRFAFDEALAVAERQLEIRREILGDSHSEVADTLVALATDANAAGDLSRAEELLREALSIRREILETEHPGLADLLDALALHLLIEGASDEIDPLAREAYEIRKHLFGDEHPAVARSLHTLGKLAYGKTDRETARRRFTEALAMQRRTLGDEHLDAAETLMSISFAERGIDYANSERLLREALAMRRKLAGDDHPLVVATLGQLAETVRWQGEPEEARQILEQVLAIERKMYGDRSIHVGSTLNNLAMAHWHLREYPAALPLLETSAAIYGEVLGPAHRHTLTVRSNLGMTHGYLGQYDKASEILKRTLEDAKRLAETREARQSVMVVLGYQARVADRQGDLARAEELGLRTLEWALNSGEETAGAAGSYEGLGTLRAGLGDLEGAEDYFAKAARSWEGARRRAGSGIKPATFKKTPYEYLAVARLERGHAENAWPAVERARARVLADLLIAEPDGEGNGELPFPLERVQAALSDRTAIVGWLDFQLRRDMPRFWVYVVRSKGPVRWVRLPSDSDRDVESLAERLRAFRDRLGATASPLGRRSAEAPRKQARTLWEQRFAPLEPYLGDIEELVVIPSWAMGGFPLDALVDDRDRLLGERFAISYSPSATLHAWLYESRSRSGRPRAGLLVGDPPFRKSHVAAQDAPEPELLAASATPTGPSVLRSALRGDQRSAQLLPRLSWSRSEVTWAARAFPESTLLLGREASEPEIEKLASSGSLGRYDVVHIATHAFIDNEKPERSGLVLSQVDLPQGPGPGPAARAFDGIVSGAEIIREWKLGADLVTLSACQTAHGRNVYGEGVVGLAYPFLQAGARSLLVSLWQVDDHATALLMRRFYESWLGEPSQSEAVRMSKVEALREAKRWLRDYRDEQGNRPYRHPYYWSAFILIGDGG